MVAIPNTPDLKAMIGESMREAAPAMHKSLSRSGRLNQALEDRAALAREIHYQTMGVRIVPVLQSPAKNPMDQIAAADQVARESWETALALAMEFPQESSEEAETA